jgi:hypothetical protein
MLVKNKIFGFSIGVNITAMGGLYSVFSWFLVFVFA